MTKKMFAFDASFEENKHPRGQPNNAGQFGPGGGGNAAKGSKAAPAWLKEGVSQKQYQEPERKSTKTVTETHLAKAPEGLATAPAAKHKNATVTSTEKKGNESKTSTLQQGYKTAPGTADYYSLLKEVKITPNERHEIQSSVANSFKQAGVGALLKTTIKTTTKHAYGVAHATVTEKIVHPAIEAACGVAIAYCGVEGHLVEGLAVAVAGYAVDKLMEHLGMDEESSREFLVKSFKKMGSWILRQDAESPNMSVDAPHKLLGLYYLIHTLMNTDPKEMQKAGKDFDIKPWALGEQAPA